MTGPAGRLRRLAASAGLLGAACLVAAGPARAQGKPENTGPIGGIYTCTDAQGRKLTSDRPLPECRHKEQRLLNRDGSLREVIPPTLTADERAERDAAERRAAEERAARADAVRRDRNLMARFPDEASHRKARESALDTVRLAMKASTSRLKDLAAERKPLLEEAEFYRGRTLPARLKQQLESVEASVDAQRSSILTQEAELVRINRLFDVELDRLRRLWAGAQPGSLGPVPSVADAPPPTSRLGTTP